MHIQLQTKQGPQTVIAQAETIQRTTPEGFIEAQYWRISDNKTNLVLAQILAIGLTLVWGVLFYLFARLMERTGQGASADTTIMLLSYLGVLLIHELIHGLTMLSFGAKPKYGVMWKELMFYATSPGYAFTRNQFLAVSYAPFVVVTLAVLGCLAFLHLPYLTWPLIAAGAGNAGGAIGDIWISKVVLRYPAEAKIMDEKDGVRIFVAAGKSEVGSGGDFVQPNA
jgi:hypothetical protein